MEAGRQASFKWPLAGRRRTDVNGEKSRNFDDNRPEPVLPPHLFERLVCERARRCRQTRAGGTRGDRVHGREVGWSEK